jgi:hypothetical protein
MKRVVSTLVLFLFLALAATAQTTNGLSEAEIKGQQLAQQLCEIAPTGDSTNTGVLDIRDNGNHFEFPIKCYTIVAQPNWLSVYKAADTHSGAACILAVTHNGLTNNLYDLTDPYLNGIPTLSLVDKINYTISKNMLPDKEKATSFAGSDFWICDFGLEFFHWPEQKVLKHESRRTRACTVLESTNPNLSAGGYSRVDSWIDNETRGIVHAEAYDANGKLLKVFDPKSFKKVNGQWELQDMEIRNVQTGSRTWIKFDLNAKP